ncbi:MAG TPA: acetyltransferase [Geobacter sp.]|nr:acetyltransferase [Geobacter sp.]
MAGNLLHRLLGKLAMVLPGGYTLRPWLHRIRGVQLGKNVWISQLVYIDEIHPEKIVIGDNVTIGLGCTIFAHFYLGDRSLDQGSGKVVIERGVFIGPNCTILNGVTIGEGSVVVAGSVVTKSVPPGVLFGPSPCAPLARITHPLIREGKVYYDRFLFGLKKL